LKAQTSPCARRPPLSLALHELATNAVKYGALSDSSGELVVKWRMRDDETLVLEWEETGVTPKADTNAAGLWA
jgi:two-component sensor histidine kinase